MYLEQTQTNMINQLTLREQVTRKVLQMEFSPGGLGKSLRSGTCVPHLGRFQEERNISQVASLPSGIFSEGIRQGNKDSFNESPLRAVDRVTEGQMAFSGPAGLQ